jgi:hypothetical protein
VIIRHDVPDAEYHVDGSEFPALADLPFAGHGVLIADRWMVTAAHAVSGRPVESATIDDRPRTVAEVIVHPGYKQAPAELWSKALSSGDAAPLDAFASEVDDIGLIRLVESVSGVTPTVLYRKRDERDRIAEVLGRGATGTGVEGQHSNPLYRGELRRVYQRVASADERWLVFRFDAPPQALPLAGQPGDGDSGGPVLIESGGLRYLAGIVSHKPAIIDIANYHPGAYGSLSYQTRISQYTAWIDGVIGVSPGN